DASRRLEQADDCIGGHRLAGARLADNAQDFARHDVEGHVIDGHERAAPGRKLDRKIAHAEDWLDHRSFGFSASRSQSPSRFTESTSAASAMPGKIAIHHSPENRKLLPMRMSVPSEGWEGGSPTPRNESVASVMIASTRLIVASTRTGPMTFGSTCRNMIARAERPMMRAACTYSLLRSTSVEERTVRAYCTQ